MRLHLSERRDLNPRPLAPQASALAGLRHVPNTSSNLKEHLLRPAFGGILNLN